MGGVNGPDLAAALAALARSWDENAAEERRAMGRPTVSVDEAVSGPYVADTWETAARELRDALGLLDVTPEHATVDGVVLRDQTAGELGLTEGTRNDGDAARCTPGGER